MKQKLKDFIQTLRDHPRARWIVAGLILFLLLIGGVAVALKNSVQVERLPTSANVQDQLPELEPSPTTGRDVSPAIAKRPIISVIVSNSVGARPQAGLDSADIVFETIAEGGITRYLAMFHDQNPENIGPIRSLRPYFIDWAIPFDAALAHVGGSDKALDQAKTRLKGRDLDEFKFGRAIFTRVSSRRPPHNTYSSYDRLLSAAKQLGMETSEATSLDNRVEPVEPAKDASVVSSISIPFSSGSYATAWNYNRSSNSYRRNLAGAAHVDAGNNKQIDVDVVIVLRTKFGVDHSGGAIYANPQSTGSGEAVIFQNGTAVKATWNRKADGQYTLTKDGKPIAINKGQLWIAVQPDSQRLSYD